jgi:hypothetical protein
MGTNLKHNLYGPMSGYDKRGNEALRFSERPSAAEE